MLTIARIVAIVSAGLLAGIYLGYRAGPYYALQGFSQSNFIQFQQGVHAHYVKFMPPLILVAVITAFAWFFGIWSQRTSAEFWLVAIAICGLIAVAAMTRAVNVPLNNQLMTWSISAPPADLREIWAPWDRVNVIRTIISVVVLLLEAAALSLRASANLL